MSKHTYNKIRTRQLILIMIMSFAAVLCSSAETEHLDNFGRENPFEMVDPSKADQLQSAIQLALEKSGSGSTRNSLSEVTPEKYIKSIMLKFLRATNVLPIVTNMVTEYGTASIDEDTNTLIICDTKESLEKILAEIKNVDKMPQQILIEVVIVDVQLSNDTELGVNWDNLFQIGGDFLGSVSYAQQLNDLTTGGSLTLIKGRIENTIKALQKERNTEILASPRVLVLSGQEAYLETIEEIPYIDLTQTGSGGGTENPIASTEFKNAGITLTVKATITDEGLIMIEIEPDQSINTGIAGVGSTNVPIIDRRKVKTTLLMEDGDISVIGGLRSKDVRIIQDKIPLLGDLPIIGGFFSNDKEVIEHSELLILISPHVYKAGDGLSEQDKIMWEEAKGLKPVRLHKKIRPEQELVKKIVPQNKLEKK